MTWSAPSGAFKELFADLLGGSAAKAEARQTLGVAEDADQAAIKAAHRRLAKQTHPDTPGGDRDAFERITVRRISC